MNALGVPHQSCGVPWSAFVERADLPTTWTCVHGGMPRRPRVLVAIRPLLLADLVRAALPSHFDVVVRPLPSPRWRRWDVAVVPEGTSARLRARHVVAVPCAGGDEGGGRDFRSLVALVQRLGEIR